MIFLILVLVPGSTISTMIPTTFAEQYGERQYSEEIYDKDNVKENDHKKSKPSSEDGIRVTADTLYQIDGLQQFEENEENDAIL